MKVIKKPGLNLAAKIIGIGGVIACVLAAAAYMLMFYENLPFEVPSFIPLLDGFSWIHMGIIGGVAVLCIVLSIIFAVASRGKVEDEVAEAVADVAEEVAPVAEAVAEEAPVAEEAANDDWATDDAPAAEEVADDEWAADDAPAAEEKKGVLGRTTAAAVGFASAKYDKYVPEKGKKACGKVVGFVKKNSQFALGVAAAIAAAVAVSSLNNERKRKKERKHILSLLK